MTDYTASQAESAVENAKDFEGWGEAEYWVTAENQPKYYTTHKDARLLLDIDGVLEYAEYIDGKLPAEGGGERVYIIFRIGTQYFRKHGYYASHYGTDWDGSVEEVRPVEKVVTVYETH